MKEPCQPTRITSPSGLSVELNANGSIRRMDHGDIILNLFPGNEAEGGPANLWLRRLDSQPDSIPLLGPASPSAHETSDRGMSACGVWGDLVFRAQLKLAESAAAWFWHVEVENIGPTAITCDLIHCHDLALAHYGAVRLNEYYVSQYIDHSPLEHPGCGSAVASRQNQTMGGRFPWAVLGSLNRGVAYATDALQFHGLATRACGKPDALRNGLPGKRLQHEHSMVSIQDEPFVLEPGAKSQCGFFGLFVADKPGVTSDADISLIDQVLRLPEATPLPFAQPAGKPSPTSLFVTAPRLDALDLDESATHAFFGSKYRHAERENGQLLSFFTGDRSHVVLKAKEFKTLRPHGHILRSGGSLSPDESALTSTTWMAGVFHSMVTQGHVSINRFLSTCHSYLGLFRSHGQRVFAEIDGRWHLLDVPSAFEMTPDSCRWIYRHSSGVIEVVSSAPTIKHQLDLAISVLDGSPLRFFISHHIALNGDEPSIEDITREFNRGMWTIGYTGQSPERLKKHMQYQHHFDKTTLRAVGGPCDGDFYGLPWPCWGTPEMNHPGTANLYDMSLPVSEGGLTFRARFGVEHNGQNILADGVYSKNSEIKDGYPEFTMQMLMDLGWDGDLTAEERASIDAVAGPQTNWKTDLSGGIQRVAIKHECAPFGNAKARAIVWNFPDPVPLHREPLYTNRRDLVADYPTYEDKTFWRVPTMYESIQKKDFSKEFPIILTSGRLVEYEGGGDETRSNPWLAELQQDMFIEINPRDANNLNVRDGSDVWVHGPEGAKIKVKAMVTERVGEGVAFMPFHFGGHYQGKDLRDKYPKGADPIVLGESTNTVQTYGYDSVTQMQETKATLCSIMPA